MILARKVTRSYDFYQEVDITDELIGHLEQVFDFKLHIDNLNSDEDYELLWSNLEEMQLDEGNVIFQEREVMPNQNYDDVAEYYLLEQSNLIEKEEAY